MTTQPSDWAVAREQHRHFLLSKQAELKPCPWCERAVYFEDDPGGYNVKCHMCSLKMCFPNVPAEKAVERWNKRTRELDASGGGHGVPPEVVGSFVERAAQIISGAPFPSGRSLYKARQISDLALSMYATPRAAEAGDDTRRLEFVFANFRRFVKCGDYWFASAGDGPHMDADPRAAIDKAMGAVGAGVKASE